MSSTEPELDFERVLKRFGGFKGLHARLARTPRLRDENRPAMSTVRVWRSRSGIPGQFVLPIMFMLIDEGEDPFAFVKVPEPDDPFEGII